MLEHANEGHCLGVDRFEHRLKILRSRRLKVPLQHVLVLVIKRLVLLGIVFYLTLKGLDLLLKFHHVQLLQISIVFERLILFSEQSDRILKLLRITVPVFIILHILQSGKIKSWDTHLDDVFLGASIANVFIVEAEVHLHVALGHRQLVV